MNGWIWVYDEPVLIPKEKMRPDGLGRGGLNVWDADGHLYPHMKWGVDLFETKEELICHRKEELDRNVSIALREVWKFDDLYKGTYY